MQKERYLPLDMEIVKFDAEDVILTSGESEISYEDDELPLIPKK